MKIFEEKANVAMYIIPIVFVCDPAWAHFRSAPRRRGSRAKVRAAGRTESALDLFNRDRRLLGRKLRADEEMSIPSAPEALDPYGEDDPVLLRLRKSLPGRSGDGLAGGLP
jgi:hypothetical protein